MKKTVSLFIILIIVFSLCSCGKVSEGDNEYYTDADGNEYYGILTDAVKRDYADSTGRTVSAIDLSLPRLDESVFPGGAKVINNYFGDMGKTALEKMVRDTDNVAEYLDRFGIDGIRKTEINYEVKYQSNSLISFVVFEKAAVDLDSVTAEPTPLTFSLVTGEQLSIKSFLADEEDEDGYLDGMLAGVYKAGNETYSPNKIPLSDEKKALLAETFNENEFYVSDDSYTFIFPLNYVSGGSREGYYYCEVPCDYVSDYYIEPKTFGAES